MTPLLALLALMTSGVAHAETPWSVPSAALSADPANTSLRFDVASALSEVEGMDEEALAALLPFLGDPALGDAARDRIVRLLLTRDTRPGWSKVYDQMLREVSDPSVRTALLRLDAEAEMSSFDERDEGFRTLMSLCKADAADGDLALRVVDAWLDRGDVANPVRLLRSFHGRREARERLVLASMHPNVSTDLAWWLTVLGEAGFTESEARSRIGDVATGEEARAVAALQRMYLDEVVDTDADRVLPVVPEGPLGLAIENPDRLNRAIAFAEAGYTQGAVDVLSRPLPSDTAPEAVAAVKLMQGNLLLGQDRSTVALAAFRDALRAVPGMPEARLGEARALSALGLHDKALDALGSNNPEVQKDIYAAKLVAQAANTRGDAGDEALLREAFDTMPNNPDVARAWGVWLADNDQPLAALAPLQTALAANPGDGLALGKLMDAALLVDQPQVAIEAAHVGLPKIGNVASHAGLRESLVWSWVKLGEQHKRAGAVQDATDAYIVAHTMKPTEGAVLRGLGGALWSNNRKEEAYAAYREAHRLNPKDTDALRAIVELALVTDREAEARAMISRYDGVAGVKSIGKRLDLRMELDRANADLAAGNRSSALARYERLLAKAPGDPDVLRGIGGAWLAQQEGERALGYFRQAQAAQPDNPWSDLGIANSYLAMGDLDASETMLGRLEGVSDAALQVEVAATKSTLLRLRGAEAQRAGNLEKAFSLYKEALDRDESAFSYTALGNLYRDTRQRDLAATMYRQALQVDPLYAPARESLVHLLLDAGLLDAAQEAADEVAGTAMGTELSRDVRIGRELERARVARELGDLDEARRLTKKTVEAYPDAEMPMAAWRSLQLEYGEPAEIRDRSIEWLEADGEDMPALRALLGASHRLQETEQVLPLFLAATESGESQHEVLYGTARLAADLEAARGLYARGQRRAAIGRVAALEGRALDLPDRWALVGGTWLALNASDEAQEAYETALLLDPRFAPAHVGKAVALRSAGKAGQATRTLEEEWESYGEPDVGLALADLYIDRGQPKKARRVLGDLTPEAAARAGSRGELPAVQSDMAPSDSLPPLDRGASLSPEQAERRRDLNDGVAGANLPGVEAGIGYYARPGEADRQFLNAIFVPVRVHDLNLGPLSFNVEAVPVLLTDGENSEQGARLSGGVAAALGPVGLNFQGGVSELGFEAAPFFMWYGGISVRPVETLMIGLHTGKDPVTDSLTSWAGQLDNNGQVFGRVARTWFGGYLSVDPTPDDNLAIAGRGGWNDGLQMERSPFWEVSGSGDHTLRFGLGALKIGAEALAMSFRDQYDLFRPGEGGYFSPDLFVYGGVRVDGGVHTADERFYACLGGSVGPQLIRADPLTDDPENYIGSGLFPGGAVRTSVDWRLAQYWRVGIDYTFQATGAFWQQHIAMAHLHFGPSNTWQQRPNPSFSPLAGPPVQQVQGCSL